MHKIFVWSIQHTGTFFASHTIASAYSKEKQLRVGSIYERHQKLGHTRFTKSSPIELSDFVKSRNHITPEWFDQAITTVCTPEELANKRILVGHEHHHKAESWMIKSVACNKPTTPIIVPMRDPILSLHSKLWRAKAWAPDNRTFNLVKRTKKIEPAPRWEKFKERYLAGDVLHTRKLMALEFDLLHREDHLKELMENAGYKDMLWW